MTTTTRRRVNPAQVRSAAILSKPICCCELIPAGIPGLATINETTYVLAYNATLPEAGEPVVHGYRLTSTDTYKSYDLLADLADCSCPDFIFRRNTVEHPRCKHQIALAIYKESGKIV